MRWFLLMPLATGCAFAADRPHGDDDATTVTVVATAGGVALGDAQVIVHNADGATIATATTDAAGLARVDVGPFITVVAPIVDETSSLQVMTLAGAIGGETLRVAASPRREPADIAIRVTGPSDAGAARYRIVSTCGDAGVFDAPPTGPLEYEVSLRCAASVMDLAIVSLDDSGRAVRAIWRMSVPVAPSAVAAVVSLAGSTYAPVARSKIDYTHVPPSVGRLSTERAMVTSRGTLASEAGEVSATAGSASVALALPTTPDTIELVTTAAGVAPAGMQSTHSIVTWGPMAPSRAIDLGALLAPYVERPVYDHATRSVTWSETEGPRAGFVIAGLYSTAGNTGWTWRIASPRGEATTLSLPQLPEELAGLAGNAGSQVIELTSLASATDLLPIALALGEPVTFAATSGELVRQALSFDSERVYDGPPCVSSSVSSSCARPLAVKTAR